MTLPIIDFHCDLLAYLQANEKNTALNPQSRCSLPQLLQGKVTLQVLSLFTQTIKGSHRNFYKQLQLFRQMIETYDEMTLPPASFQPHLAKICLCGAVENASGILEEDEPFDLLYERFTDIEKFLQKIAYVSLTWNGENRFGGGNETDVGLKRDGKLLIDHLEEKQISVDFSHTSDRLAAEIIQYFDEKKIATPPIASHSNFRFMCNLPRNLPDEFAREIFHRKGLIGINLLRSFLGDSVFRVIDHIEYGISLGGENHLCLGSDFFGGLNLPLSKFSVEPLFFEEYADASCFQKLIMAMRKHLGTEVTEKIAYKNAKRFLEKKKFLEKV